jgi:hypothetical protein
MYNYLAIDEYDKSGAEISYERQVSLGDLGPWNVELKGLEIDFETKVLSFGWRDVLTSLCAREMQHLLRQERTRNNVRDHVLQCSLKECPHKPWCEWATWDKKRDEDLQRHGPG